MIVKTALRESARTNVIKFPRMRRPARTTAQQIAAGALNRNELTSIKALTGYVAHNHNVPEDTVRNYLMAAFHVTDVIDLKRADYDRVIRFLVDLQVDLILN